jgi:hypothetical protein
VLAVIPDRTNLSEYVSTLSVVVVFVAPVKPVVFIVNVKLPIGAATDFAVNTESVSSVPFVNITSILLPASPKVNGLPVVSAGIKVTSGLFKSKSSSALLF